MRTAAILPVKRFPEAKQRLGASIAEELRAELVRAMVSDVLLALSHTRAIELTIVVTCEQSITAAAREIGATVIADSAERGQSAAVAIGVQRALATGFERALCVPGDCPALDPQELEQMLATSAERDVVIVPDRHGSGTNALLLTPPDAIAPAFGVDSCERHRALARDARVACRLQRPASLLLDIDTGADLAVLRDRLAGTRARAAHTRAVLGAAERDALISIAG